MHAPCIYTGTVNGENVSFLCQVDDFAASSSSNNTPDKVFKMIQYILKEPLKCLEKLSLYNGIDTA